MRIFDYALYLELGSLVKSSDRQDGQVGFSNCLKFLATTVAVVSLDPTRLYRNNRPTTGAYDASPVVKWEF